MKKTLPLRQNYEFARVYQKGRFLSSRFVVLHYLKRQGKQMRLGITASRQISGSVQRNRVKRLLRESYRLVEERVKPGYDMILVGRNTREDPGLQGVMPDVMRLLRRAGIYRDQNQPADEPATAQHVDSRSQKP